MTVNGQIPTSAEVQQLLEEHAPLHKTEVVELVNELITIDSQIRGTAQTALADDSSTNAIEPSLDRAKFIIHRLSSILTGSTYLVELLRATLNPDNNVIS